MGYYMKSFKKIKYCVIAFLLLLFFFWGFSSAANDLLRWVIQPAYYLKTIIWIWENVNTVGNAVPWIIVLITKFLLILTITLSVTMILYNGMVYIIQTWQWKDAKSLTKNIVYIIIWILVALFSVVIITLIQSVPSTLGDTGELPTNTYTHDKDALSFKNLVSPWKNLWL